MVLAGALAAPAGGTLSKPRARYEAALAALRATDGFRFAERIDVTAPRRVVRSEVRFAGPNRVRMEVSTVAPPPTATLVSVQVGRIACQAPPGTCYRGPRADPARTVRSLIQPKGRISYAFGRAPAGSVTVTLTTKQSNVKYFARLTIGRDGLPARFATTVTRGGTVVAVQRGSFVYHTHDRIVLPPQAKKLGP